MRLAAALELTYNLLTSQTSFVAVHDTVRNTDSAAQGVVQPLPRHVSSIAVGGRRVPDAVFYLALLAAAYGIKRYGSTAGCRRRICLASHLLVCCRDNGGAPGERHLPALAAAFCGTLPDGRCCLRFGRGGVGDAADRCGGKGP